MDHQSFGAESRTNHPPYTRKNFRAESNGTATGVEGWILYGSQVGDLRIDFDNPFVDSNELRVTPPPGYEETHTDISGNHANVTVTLTRKLTD